MVSQTTSLTIVYSGHIKENIKDPRNWPLCREITGTGEVPAQMASNAGITPSHTAILSSIPW